MDILWIVPVDKSVDNSRHGTFGAYGYHGQGLTVVAYKAIQAASGGVNRVPTRHTPFGLQVIPIDP